MNLLYYKNPQIIPNFTPKKRRPEFGTALCLFLLFVFVKSKKLLSCNDADEGTAVIGDGEEVMRHKLLDDLACLCSDLQRRIAVGLEDVGDTKIFADTGYWERISLFPD